ncbi:purine-nucleoside phosphorylase [Cognatiluteimonas weifangensis]|uniref:Purine nucleoside phosphorylase DeoD-type n=1 Tax=Cognatiluteimonas weifangensis TaxID=2303539 RepID=A0A372DMQ4_9GAMM|nr:purine-nucleoside phosphorylase [Luteimonas weifangensis]RFP60878.1 purine-nucleoside phosphorylase [Luteimonas weifangensis]
MSTPHIDAAAGAFADTVLLPGDPVRARHIATQLLQDAEQVSNVRDMPGFTGHWRGRRISVMGTGMGIPSCSLYATELVREYGVRRLVRVGTCGATGADVQLGDIVVALGASTDSRVNRLRFGGYDLAALASFDLVRSVADAAQRAGARVRIGNVFSTDLFHHPDPALFDLLERHGVLGVEMEAAGLYGAAAALGVEAIAVLAVSDHIRRGEAMTPQQRATGLDAMLRIVLDGVAA